MKTHPACCPRGILGIAGTITSPRTFQGEKVACPLYPNPLYPNPTMDPKSIQASQNPGKTSRDRAALVIEARHEPNSALPVQPRQSKDCLESTVRPQITSTAPSDSKVLGEISARLESLEQGHNRRGVRGGFPMKELNLPQIVKPVPIVAKDFLPLVATDNDVVKRPFEFNPWFPGHAGSNRN
jgi:hypothetical protein